MGTFLDKFPPTVEKVVDKLMQEMSFADKTRLANMDEAALVRFHHSYGIFLRTEFRLPGNDPLMKSCMAEGDMTTITPEQASYVVLKALQKKVTVGHALRIVRS